MFVRFRKTTAGKLQVSLVEPSRSNGKVHHKHIAGLGSVPTPPSVEDRLTFWEHLHERIAKLGNRVRPEDHRKLFAAIHARIPMVMVAEQTAMQLAMEEASAEFWEDLGDMHRSGAEERKALAAIIAKQIAANEAGAANADEHAKNARDRIERLKRGEAVPASKPLTPKDVERIFRDAGFTTADLRHMDRMRSFFEAVGDVGFEAFLEEHFRLRGRAERSMQRAVMRRRRC
jgi:hypothetical protein